MSDWDIRPEPIEEPAAVAVLRRYTAEVTGRYFGRIATEADVDETLAMDPSGDLVPPHGVFLVGRHAGVVAGCVGVRLVPGQPEIAELKRLYVEPHLRGSGGAALLLAAAEDTALGFGARVLRLDTRSDLVEARAFYTRNGFAEIPAYNDEPYAEHWFEKDLTPGPTPPARPRTSC